MTETLKGKFFCNICDLTWSKDYNPSQRPRKNCPQCHKSCDLTRKNVQIPKSNKKPDFSEKEGGEDPPSNRNSFNKIDATTVETLMLKQANEGNDTVPFIRCIVDYLKIKGDSVELDEDLDLEVLRQIGINLKSSN